MTKFKKRFDDVAGKICEAILPIKYEYYVGRGKELAICTLSSIDLLKEISESKAIMDRIAIAGRLLSENKGIDAIVRFTMEHPELKRIILCGKEVKGHSPGQALLALAEIGRASCRERVESAGVRGALRRKRVV